MGPTTRFASVRKKRSKLRQGPGCVLRPIADSQNAHVSLSSQKHLPITESQNARKLLSSQKDHGRHGIISYHSNVHSQRGPDSESWSLPSTSHMTHIGTDEICQDILRLPFLQSDLIGNGCQQKKMKHGGTTRLLNSKSMSETTSGSRAVGVTSSDAAHGYVVSEKQISIGRSRSRGSVGFSAREPTRSFDDHDDMTEEPSPLQRLVAVTVPSSASCEPTPSLDDYDDMTEQPSPMQRLNVVTVASKAHPSEASVSTPSSDNELHPDGLWFHSDRVTRDITRSIQSHYTGPYTCWRATPVDVKEEWWNYFKSCYRWHVDLDQSVRDHFEKRAAVRLKDMVYKASKSKANDRIRWMTKEVREELKKVRATPKFKKKSEQSSKNKLTGSKAGRQQILETVPRLNDDDEEATPMLNDDESDEEATPRLNADDVDEAATPRLNGDDADEEATPRLNEGDDHCMTESSLPSPSFLPLQRVDMLTTPFTEASGGTSSLGDNELHPDGLWFHCNRVVRDITSCIQNHYVGPYTCWSTTPVDVKEQWWKDFKGRYQWQSNLERNVRDQFEKKGAVRLKDIVYKASKIKDDEPIPWMTKEVREELKKVRATPEFKKRSELYSKNKLTGPKAGTKHTQGSVSTVELARRMAAQNGGEVPPPSKMFLVTHQRNDKSFVDERSKKVWDTYQALKAGLQVQDGSAADRDLFLKAAGGFTKGGTVYGLGSGAGVYFERPTSHSSSQSTASSSYTPTTGFVSELQSRLQLQSEELNRTKEELKQQKQLMEDQRRQYEEQKEEQRRLIEEQKETVARLETQMGAIAKLLQGCGSVLFSQSQPHDPPSDAPRCSS